MIEPAVYLSCHPPSHNWCWERISERVLESSREQHVPGQPRVTDAADDPRASCGAEEHLEASRDPAQSAPVNGPGLPGTREVS